MNVVPDIKRRQMETLFYSGWYSRRIAAYLGLSRSTVLRYRRALAAPPPTAEYVGKLSLCIICGGEFHMSFRHRLTCSLACRASYQSMQASTHLCAICDTKFDPKSNGQKYCPSCQ